MPEEQSTTLPTTRTPAQLLKHREIQVGRLCVVLLAAAGWMSYPVFGTPGVSSPAEAASAIQLAIVFLGLTIAASTVWLWLATRTGRIREKSFWISVAKGAAIFIGLLVIRMLASSSTPQS